MSELEKSNENSNSIINIEKKVDTIFEQLNFLKLKKTSQLFLSLDDLLLEKFAEKYSSILIYLLNILDFNTSRQLILKLTKKSILYLIEEETRLLLLGEFKIDDNINDLTNISLLLDEVDAKENETFLYKKNFVEIKQALAILSQRRNKKETQLKFNYLINFDIQELSEIIKLIVEKKPIILAILILYSNDSLKQFLLKEVIKKYPEFLIILPEDIYEIKFYAILKEDAKNILQYLPKEVIEKLEYIEIVKRLENGLNKIIYEYEYSHINDKQKREKILNQIYEILLPESSEIQELLLVDLFNKGFINPKELELLQILFKHRE